MLLSFPNYASHSKPNINLHIAVLDGRLIEDGFKNMLTDYIAVLAKEARNKRENVL